MEFGLGVAEFDETGWVTSVGRREVGDRLKEGSGRGVRKVECREA